MKLVLSALLALGAFQLSSAMDTSGVMFTFKRPDSTHPYPYLCANGPGLCNGECMDTQWAEETTEAASFLGMCYFITPVSNSADRSSVDFLYYPGQSEPAMCHYSGQNDEGLVYYCEDQINQNTISTSTTTTTTTGTTTTTTTTTGTTTTTAAAGTATVTVPTCSNMDTIFGKKKGNGFNGDCCKTEADCKDSCVKGKCNGPKRATTSVKSTTSTKKDATTTTTTGTTTTTTTTTTTKKATTTTTTTKKATQTPSVCKAGYLSKKNGRGPKGACCTTHWDCKESCIKGSCN